MKIPAGLGLAVMISASAVLGCAGNAEPPKSSGPQTTTVVISYDDLLNQRKVNRSFTLSVGDFIQVSLGANPSTGYQWAAQMQITDPKVLAQTGHETLGPSAQRPGAAGSEVWVLQAIGRGTTTVSTTYGRPWEGGEKDSWTFTADVTVN